MQEKGFFKDNGRMQQVVLGGSQVKLYRLLKTEMGLVGLSSWATGTGRLGYGLKKTGLGSI